MTGHQLSQLASQVPEVLDAHRTKRGRDNDVLSQYFDFSTYYGDEEPSSSGSRTRSVTSSNPGLTLGSSEDERAHSPGPHFDSYRSKDTIKQAKQNDDRFTLPEIRPKRVDYPSKIHLDNAPSPASPGTSGNGVVILSNPPSPTSLDAALEESHPQYRGRRTRPLENPEEVAAIRKLGACYRCVYRKVKCNEEGPCSHCCATAAKPHLVGCDNIAEQMCFRQKPRLLFGDIHQIISAEYSPRPATLNNMPEYQLRIFFCPLLRGSTPLSLTVGMEHERQADWQSGSTTRIRGVGYKLSEEDTKALWDKVAEWASSQMRLEGTSSFQSALDNLVLSCLCKPQHSDLLWNLRQLRCYYKVLRQKKFAFQIQPMGELQELPADFHQFLKASLSKAIAEAEDKVWGALLNKKIKSPKSSQGQLVLWTGWMQMVLLYRDVARASGSEESWIDANMQRKAEGLMNCAAVMYDLNFGKKPPTVSMANSDIVELFVKVQFQHAEFVAQVRQGDRTLDRVLGALLVRPPKNAPKNAPKTPTQSPPQKRQRKAA
ncbi:hypothetical protein F5Y17DRAFT_4397 [Xylariaceae sp. FL0594]|nr:hypothetical protein F5Y17DRAFT_4397 [Xylariaceae sp. FL0594]